MKVSKKRIEYIADYIVGSAHDALPLVCALYNANCLPSEFKAIKKHKLIKKARKDARFILQAIWLRKQIEKCEKSNKEINNELFVRMLDEHACDDVLGIKNESDKKQTITINVLD